MKYRLAAAVLCCVAGTASASDWVPVGSSSASGIASIMLDRASVRADGGTVKVWAKYLFEQPLVLPRSNPEIRFNVYMMLSEFHCAERQANDLHADYYLGDKFVNQSPLTSGWHDVTPDSNSELVLIRACKLK
jgi:hypothetical protein